MEWWISDNRNLYLSTFLLFSDCNIYLFSVRLCIYNAVYQGVNKELTPKDQDKDKDLTPKDQDKDKDLTPKDQNKDLLDLTPQGQGQEQGPDPQGPGQGQGLEICP